MTGRIKPFDW